MLACSCSNTASVASKPARLAALEGKNSEAAEPHHPVVDAEVLDAEPTDRFYAGLLSTGQKRSSQNRDRQDSLMR